MLRGPGELGRMIWEMDMFYENDPDRGGRRVAAIKILERKIFAMRQDLKLDLSGKDKLEVMLAAAIQRLIDLQDPTKRVP